MTAHQPSTAQPSSSNSSSSSSWLPDDRHRALSCDSCASDLVDFVPLKQAFGSWTSVHVAPSSRPPRLKLGAAAGPQSLNFLTGFSRYRRVWFVEFELSLIEV